jgi:lipopolysaccharide export LptBFGC system permease protein LptF
MEVNLKMDTSQVENRKNSANRKIRFGNPDFLLFFSVMLLCFGLFNLSSGAAVAFFAIFASGIFAFVGLLVSVYRWKHLKPAEKMYFCALLLFLFLWASLTLPAL